MSSTPYPPCAHGIPLGQPCARCAAAFLGSRGGSAGKGDAKRRDKAMLQAAGRKGAAARWSKAKPEEKPEP